MAWQLPSYKIEFGSICWWFTKVYVYGLDILVVGFTWSTGGVKHDYSQSPPWPDWAGKCFAMGKDEATVGAMQININVGACFDSRGPTVAEALNSVAWCHDYRWLSKIEGSTGLGGGTVAWDAQMVALGLHEKEELQCMVPNVTDIGLKPRHIKKVAVIGGGLMGSGIATALMLGNIYVVLKEVNSEYLLKGIRTIEANVRGLVTKGKLTQDKAEKTLSLLKGVLDYSDFKEVDMVIEAVIENVPLKQKIFGEIEKVCPAHCILATNTSTIDLNLVGEKTSSQDRIVGAHFFSPAHVMPLLEIVRTEKTSAQVILDLMAVGKIIKKVPVVVGNCTGFAVNRTFFPYVQGAHVLVNLGVDVFRIDRAINSFGLPMGPFQLQDLAGYGVALATGKELVNAFPGRTFNSPLVELLVRSGRNGKNNGKGYYIYEKGSKPKPDPSVLPIIEESRQLTNIMPGGKSISVTDQEIVEMILFPAVNEACRVLGEGIVVRASDLDIASVLGMSFPSYRGGIVFWADAAGPNHVYRSLKKWSELYGNFYTPSRFLEERARRGIPLSAPTSSSPASKSRL